MVRVRRCEIESCVVRALNKADDRGSRQIMGIGATIENNGFPCGNKGDPDALPVNAQFFDVIRATGLVYDRSQSRHDKLSEIHESDTSGTSHDVPATLTGRARLIRHPAAALIWHPAAGLIWQLGRTELAAQCRNCDTWCVGLDCPSPSSAGRD